MKPIIILHRLTTATDRGQTQRPIDKAANRFIEACAVVNSIIFIFGLLRAMAII